MFREGPDGTRAEAIAGAVQVVDLAPIRHLLASLDDTRYIILAPRADAEESSISCLRLLHELTGTLLDRCTADEEASVAPAHADAAGAFYNREQPVTKHILAVA